MKSFILNVVILYIDVLKKGKKQRLEVGKQVRNFYFLEKPTYLPSYNRMNWELGVLIIVLCLEGYNTSKDLEKILDLMH